MSYSAPTPGMQDAMAILTKRVQFMDGGCTVDEYVTLIREIIEDANCDQAILVSALASLGSALLAIASGGTKIPLYELLSTIGLTLSS